MNKTSNLSGKYDGWSARKSDEWLADVLRQDDQEDRNMAMQILYDRYQPKLERFVSQKLPHDLVEDVTQEIWIGFHNRVSIAGIRKGVQNLLMGIARNKRADAVDKLTNEVKIEHDVPLTEDFYTQEKFEGYIQAEAEQFFNQLPLLIPLSDCQRTVWVLRGLYEYPPEVVGRLMNKNRNVIDTHFWQSNQRMRKYLQSEEYELQLANDKLQPLSNTGIEAKPRLIVERFSSPITPQLTSDELKPLGLTVEQFQTHFVASLIPSTGYGGRLFLSLTLKSERAASWEKDPEWRNFEEWSQAMHQWHRRYEGCDLFPAFLPKAWSMINEYLLAVNFDGERLVLTPHGSVRFLPDFLLGVDEQRINEKINHEIFISPHFGTRSNGTHIPISDLLLNNVALSARITELEQQLVKSNESKVEFRAWAEEGPFAVGEEEYNPVLFTGPHLQEYLARVDPGATQQPMPRLSGAVVTFIKDPKIDPEPGVSPPISNVYYLHD